MNSNNDNHQDQRAAARAQQRVRRRRIFRYITLVITFVISATASLIGYTPRREPEPYHTSSLSGEGWVLELLAGHPERIQSELGVHHHVFSSLISELQAMGHSSSRHVSLEEQLSIFLYSCVTGLPLRHVGERFQRSNNTISRYVELSHCARRLTILQILQENAVHILLPTILPEICSTCHSR